MTDDLLFIQNGVGGLKFQYVSEKVIITVSEGKKAVTYSLDNVDKEAVKRFLNGE